MTFQDFLCYSKDTEYETVYNPIFQEIFQEQYELSGLTQDYTYIEYMDGLLKAGEFNHEMYNPVQEFLSAGLDIITFGAKPLIEAFVGEDLITGEQMTETERYLRAIEGIVGLVSFGSIWSKLGKIGIEGITAELAIEVMSDTSSTITSTSMNELGANGIVSTVAGIIAGGITGSSINNAINTRVWSSHIETPEVPETPFQIQRETIQVEELPNRIDIDTRNNLSQLDGLEENQVGKRIMESNDNLRELSVEDVRFEGGGSSSTSRPTWRKSELDAAADFPDYDAQKSFLNGEEVPYGTKGSVRPDYYKDGFSVDIKNYNIESASGRSNLAGNIERQYYQRIENLPDGTKQSVMIDVRGQNVSEEVLNALCDDVMQRTNNGIEILFKMD